MAAPYASPTARYSRITHDPRCPECGRENRRRANCCDIHHWAYSAWLGGMQHMEPGRRRRRRLNVAPR